MRPRLAADSESLAPVCSWALIIYIRLVLHWYQLLKENLSILDKNGLTAGQDDHRRGVKPVVKVGSRDFSRLQKSGTIPRSQSVAAVSNQPMHRFDLKTQKQMCRQSLADITKMKDEVVNMTPLQQKQLKILSDSFQAHLELLNYPHGE